jgi:hypothetical protein
MLRADRGESAAESVTRQALVSPPHPLSPESFNTNKGDGKSSLSGSPACGSRRGRAGFMNDVFPAPRNYMFARELVGSALGELFGPLSLPPDELTRLLPSSPSSMRSQCRARRSACIWAASRHCVRVTILKEVASDSGSPGFRWSRRRAGFQLEPAGSRGRNVCSSICWCRPTARRFLRPPFR